MSPTEPLDATDRSLMWRVAAHLVRNRPRNGSGSRLLDLALQNFSPVDENTLLQDATRASIPLDLGQQLGWIIARPLDGPRLPEVPIITIQLDGDSANITRCCVRVAILHERDDGTIGATGWRFELAEVGGDAIHPYQHAQHIIGWTISGTCLLHPPEQCPTNCNGLDPGVDGTVDDERRAAQDRVNQSHPAFPLPTRTLTGLMSVAVASLYGAASIKTLLDNDARLARASGAIAADFDVMTS